MTAGENWQSKPLRESQTACWFPYRIGPGIDPSKFDRIFDAFYTTKPDGLGMGDRSAALSSKRMEESCGLRLPILMVQSFDSHYRSRVMIRA